MISYLLKNIFWNPSIIKFGLLFILSALICTISYLILRIIHKRNMLTFEEYIPIEQTVVSLLIAIWSFGLFCLPFALIIWISFYLIYPQIATKNQILGYFLENPSKSYSSGIIEKHFRSMSQKTLLKEIFQEKKLAKENFNKSFKTESLPKNYIPTRIYLSGIIFYFFLSLAEQNTISNSNFIWLVFLDNLIAFFGVFYAIYLLLYLTGVKHWLGDWHFYPKLFDILAIIFLIIGIVIVVAITFYH